MTRPGLAQPTLRAYLRAAPAPLDSGPFPFCVVQTLHSSAWLPGLITCFCGLTKIQDKSQTV